MIRIAILALLAVLLPALAPAGAADLPKTLRIATEGDYPPFSYRDEAGRLVGFDIDLAEALCRAMQVTCDIRPVPWAIIIDDLLAGNSDAIVASMSITEERKQRVAFTNRYYRTPMQLVGRKGVVVTDITRDLAGKPVAAEAQSTAHFYLRDVVKNARMLIFPTQKEAHEAILSGKADYVLADSLVMWRFTKDHPEFEFVGQPIYVDEGIGIALRKEDGELLKAFNRAIARIRLDGTYKAINAKYFPFDIY